MKTEAYLALFVVGVKLIAPAVVFAIVAEIILNAIYRHSSRFRNWLDNLCKGEEK